LMPHLLAELTVLVFSHLLSSFLDHTRHSALRPKNFTLDIANPLVIVSHSL
jgi:hypothetical protein